MARPTIKQRSNGRTLSQYAALPYIRNADGGLEVLVMSSRETRRAVIPKGWPMKSRKSWKVAEIEARQEAGLVGEIGRRSIGQYLYWKRLEQSFVLVKVSVHPLKVTRHLTDWPEKHERTLFWMSPEDAATLVDEPELGDLIRDFAHALNGKGKKPARPRRLAKKAGSKATPRLGKFKTETLEKTGKMKTGKLKNGKLKTDKLKTEKPKIEKPAAEKPAADKPVSDRIKSDATAGKDKPAGKTGKRPSPRPATVAAA